MLTFFGTFEVYWIITHLGVFKAFETAVLSAGYHPTPNYQSSPESWNPRNSRIPRNSWMVHLAPISRWSRLSRTLTL